MEQVKVKKKLNYKALIVILLVIYLIVMLCYYLFTMPIKSINVNGTNVLEEKDVLKPTNLNNYPSFIWTSVKSIKNALSKNPLISSINVKKHLNGTIDINIEEEKILFYYLPNNEYILSNQKKVTLDEKRPGIPVLVNFTPEDILNNLNLKMSDIDPNILYLINEIEYKPDIKDGITIDENRFILRMNDGNRVIINIANFEKFASYRELYATIEETEKGTFYLDGNRPRVLFRTYEAENNALGEDLNDGSSELPQ